jgi:hypothetical protein
MHDHKPLKKAQTRSYQEVAAYVCNVEEEQKLLYFLPGIFPFNPAVIPESAFLPSDPFDAPLPENENNNNLPAINESQDKRYPGLLPQPEHFHRQGPLVKAQLLPSMGCHQVRERTVMFTGFYS